MIKVSYILVLNGLFVHLLLLGLILLLFELFLLLYELMFIVVIFWTFIFLFKRLRIMFGGQDYFC